MKLKEFKETQLFQQMNVCKYFDGDGYLIPDKLLKNLQNKEVINYRMIPTPPLNTMCIFLEYNLFEG